MADQFLLSAQSSDFSLAVGDDDYDKDKAMQRKKGQKVADILFADRNTTAEFAAGGAVKTQDLEASGLYLVNEQGSKSYNLVGSKLFCLMSPAYDTTLPSRHQRDMIYVSGQSGSGKSTWCAQYARAYQKSFHKHASGGGRIIIFSAVKEDPAFAGVKLKRVVFDDLIEDGEVVEDAIIISDLKNSLTIFDDVDVIPNKKLRLWVQDLRNQCLQHGRHDNINMLCTTHQLMNYKETKILLMEATKVVFFPNSGGAAQIKRFLKTYGELDAKQIQDVFQIKSRWVMLNKAAPRFILHASGCYML